MVKIRLTRTGGHFDPTYRIVVADSRSSRDGKIIEQVGFFDPNTSEVRLDEEKVLTWLGKGAKPSDTVRSLLSKAGIIAKFTSSKK